MSDLISRQAAMEALQEKVFHDLSDEFYGAMQVLDELPSAVVPVIHAHWEKHFKRLGVYEDLYWHCTNCNSRTLEEYAPYWWSYCPHCGAKMDEEVE